MSCDLAFGVVDRQPSYKGLVVPHFRHYRDSGSARSAVPKAERPRANPDDRATRKPLKSLAMISRLAAPCRATLRGLLVAFAIAVPAVPLAAGPVLAETVIRPQGSGPIFTGNIGPWEFFRVRFSDGATACSMVGFVGRKKAPTFSFAAYFNKAGKFDGSEIRFEGIPGKPPTGAAAKAQLEISGKAFAMEHPENLAHTGFFLANWNQSEAVVDALADLSKAKGNRSFFVVQGGRSYKFDARDFGTAFARLKEKCGFGQ